MTEPLKEFRDASAIEEEAFQCMITARNALDAAQEALLLATNTYIEARNERERVYRERISALSKQGEGS